MYEIQQSGYGDRLAAGIVLTGECFVGQFDSVHQIQNRDGSPNSPARG